MDDTFEPAEKAIYGYQDGSGKKVFADPKILLGNLATGALTRGKNIDELIECANPAYFGKMELDKLDAAKQIDSWNALATLDEIVREAFTLTPFNSETGTGADMAHALGLLNHFHLWCEKKNRQRETTLTSQSAEFQSDAQKTTGTTSV